MFVETAFYVENTEGVPQKITNKTVSKVKKNKL
jgi:hypothetical protein